MVAREVTRTWWQLLPPAIVVGALLGSAELYARSSHQGRLSRVGRWVTEPDNALLFLMWSAGLMALRSWGFFGWLRDLGG